MPESSSVPADQQHTVDGDQSYGQPSQAPRTPRRTPMACQFCRALVPVPQEKGRKVTLAYSREVAASNSITANSHTLLVIIIDLSGSSAHYATSRVGAFNSLTNAGARQGDIVKDHQCGWLCFAFDRDSPFKNKLDRSNRDRMFKELRSFGALAYLGGCTTFNEVQIFAERKCTCERLVELSRLCEPLKGDGEGHTKVGLRNVEVDAEREQIGRQCRNIERVDSRLQVLAQDVA
ncbi:hypothetical protein BKA70DRAFT_1225097 [Coprinopsis sp. MPI-PUGE-AT-0042]|nr:hypothetical protein BKA70DRAFT_1225097 [Coprinopsis sp. MPI-PUGE-AT-0042]